MRDRRPRWREFDYTGKHRYFLTFCTGKRRAVFTSADIVATTWSQILRAAGETSFYVTAYVFMPDHIHLLVEGTTTACELRRFVSLAKQRAAYTFGQQHDQPLWQPSFYDHVLREEESDLPFIRYIIENPLRSGLVDRIEDYPFIDTGALPVSEMIRMLDEAGVPVWCPTRKPDEECRQP